MSEEHVRRWSHDQHIPIGRIVPSATMWRVARLWYGGRLEESWRPPAISQKQAMLEGAGLIGPFWTLPSS
jgi:hypothetical protein